MNERFTLDSTVTEISENERVNKKLPIFFDLALCSQIKWPFSKMKLKNMMKMTKFPGQELVDAANFILERREAGDKITIPIWRRLPENEAEAAERAQVLHPPLQPLQAVWPSPRISAGLRHLPYLLTGTGL